MLLNRIVEFNEKVEKVISGMDKNLLYARMSVVNYKLIFPSDSSRSQEKTHLMQFRPNVENLLRQQLISIIAK